MIHPNALEVEIDLENDEIRCLAEPTHTSAAVALDGESTPHPR
eukprot:CAMPEP_0113327934 /NCGR_PEP_ID=MMETSP0010_2-20120614/19656_1 /TAXON_ID=216773 ORGANISM="Corethron hystrix, Strain 308" /NCGR_SAMPLE_ID=MMETSP0010_2 /ASSEMBLY_ACC=CAM_ASM_000155 /LENGTH=42 /DNA_ID=CAMNT_0000189039 /DNA_START=38 /DNA_END=162 /DNA_ORIENTATION=+ /assembly_acc=CAM_ASM_000155